jgi:lipopolysaccharide export LptBFGC system permease protein LptF
MDRYLGSQVLWRLGAATLIITCSLMLERMLQMVDLLVSRGMPLRPVASMLAYLLPYFFEQALPAAFLVAALLAVARLREEGAVEVMLSSGIGIHWLLRPLAALSAILLFVSVIVAGWIEPNGRYAYHPAIYDLTHLNARLARAAAFVFLPFLALALRSFWRRSRGVHGGLLAGLVPYIAYDHAMNFIDAVVARSESVPAAIYWLVSGLFTLLSVWLIWLVAFRLMGNPLSATLESIAGAFCMRSETGSEQPSCS